MDGGDTHPFTQAQKVSYQVQAGDALAAGTYFWRAKAIDPSGSNTWSAWTAVRSFTVAGLPGEMTAISEISGLSELAF